MVGVWLSRNARDPLEIAAGFMREAEVSNNKTEALQFAIQLFHVERLAEVAVAAGFERGFFHPVNVKCRDGDDGNVLSRCFELANLFYRFESINNRHVQIH